MDNPRTAAPSGSDVRSTVGSAERGVALIMALLFTIIVAGLTMSGTLLLRSHIQKNRTSFASKSQALQVARSGLADGLSWLRRQTSQPVITFSPVLDTVATPQILDTIEPDIGLVREFKITGKTWARYEVWKPWAGDPNPTRLAWRQQYQCEDVSASRAQSSPGTVWRLRSVGYIYERVDPGVPFNQAPNRVLSSHVAVNEVRRMVISLPATAAVNVQQGSTCVINANGRIVGGASQAGLVYAGTGPSAASLARVSGTPQSGVAVGSPYRGTYEDVFGVTLDALKSSATLVVTNTADIPNPMPEMGLVVIDAGAVTFTAAKPLVGTGIVVVRGNVTISPGSNSNFSGLLYVDGDLTMRSPCEINGSVLCLGSMLMQGAADYATINYDGDILSTLMTQLGNYRQSSTTWLPRGAH